MKPPLLLRPALPVACAWVRRVLATRAPDAKPLFAFAAPRVLVSIEPWGLPPETGVVVTERLPGLSMPHTGIAAIDARFAQGYVGITLGHLVFLHPRVARDDGVLLHELVHVRQWQRLGVERFVSEYVGGVWAHGYRHCPLEVEAYDLEASWRRG